MMTQVIVLVISPCYNWQILSIDWEYEPVEEERFQTLLTNRTKYKLSTLLNHPNFALTAEQL
jgi:hypothetical protein